MNLFLTLFIVLSLQLSADGLLDVIWPKSLQQYTKQQKSYPLALQKAVKDVELPVYLPRPYIEDKSLFFVSDANFYTATISLDGAMLSITGDRTYQQKIKSKDPIFTKRIKDKTITFSNAEGIMMTDFNRHNVNYTLEVECDAPKEDPRCTQEDFLKKIYNELVLVGGKR